MARTAVAAGTWTAVSNRVARRQQQRWADQDAQQYYQQPAPQYYQPAAPAAAPAAPAAAPAADDRIERLKELGALKSQGILTEEEFAAEKARILNG
jgi:putative oligomerization/nucleic acid binding protein